MISKKLKAFRDLLLTVTEHVYHYYHQAEDETYIIWTETGEDASDHGDNHKSEIGLSYEIEVFTKTEYSPVLDDLVTKLNESGYAFSYTAVSYETDTHYIHHSLEANG